MQQSGNPTKKYQKNIIWNLLEPEERKTHFRVHPVPQKGTDPWEGKTVKESLKNMLVWFKEVLHPPNRNGFLVTTSLPLHLHPPTNVLLVKIEVPVWYLSSYTCWKGFQTNPSISQPTNGKNTSTPSTPSKRQGTLFLTFKLCCKKRITRCLGARRSNDLKPSPNGVVDVVEALGVPHYYIILMVNNTLIMWCILLQWNSPHFEFSWFNSITSHFFVGEFHEISIYLGEFPWNQHFCCPLHPKKKHLKRRPKSESSCSIWFSARKRRSERNWYTCNRSQEPGFNAKHHVMLW